MTSRPVTVRTVRSVVGSLPATSERSFSSGAPRFLVAERQFAYVKPDLTTLVVRVDAEDWEALTAAVDASLRPETRSYPRQRGFFASVDLRTASQKVVRDALIDAWLTCVPRDTVTRWRRSDGERF